MNVRYWIPPDTAAFVSVDGGAFEPHITKSKLIFEQPAEETADEMLFVKGTLRLRVARAKLWKYEWDGVSGTNRPCG